MKRYTVGVSGWISIDVVARDDDAAEEIVRKLYAGELPAAVERTLDQNQVDALLTLYDPEVGCAVPATPADSC